MVSGTPTAAILLPMTMPWTLIANPAAGDGGAAQTGTACAARLRDSGRPVDLRLTQGPSHATELAAEAVQQGHGAVVVCGGDGSIARVLPALAQTQTALGIIPAGTGNDLARALGIPRSPAAAVRLLCRERPRAMDLGKCGDRWFATVAAFGFDAEVSETMLQGRAPLPGAAGYVIESLRHLRKYQAPRIRLSGDFGDLEQEVFLTAIANTRSYGGGMRIAPSASPDDGCFDVCVIDGSLSKASLLGLLPRVFWGGHIQHPGVRMLRTRSIQLEAIRPEAIHPEPISMEPVARTHLLHADGEPLTELSDQPAIMRVETNALRVIRPTAPVPSHAYHVVPGTAGQVCPIL